MNGKPYYARIIERLRDYDTCHDGDVDEAATLIEHMADILTRTLASVDAGRQLSPELISNIRDIVKS